MSIEVEVYGRLAKNTAQSGIETVELDAEEVETVSDVPKILGLGEKEINHIFLNHKYSKISAAVSDGDRLALIPKDMGLLYKWHFSPG